MKGHLVHDSIYRLSRADKPAETESRLVVARGWWGGGGKCCLMGTGFLLG